jgi:hypothetical protein
MKSEVKQALDKEKQKNQRQMVEGVDTLITAFKKVEEAVMQYKAEGSKDYSKVEKAVKKYQSTLQNVK